MRLHEAVTQEETTSAPPIGPATKAKSSRLGQLYLKYLRRYAVIRLLVNWIWRNLFLVNWFQRVARRYPLTLLSFNVAEAHKTRLVDAEIVTIAPPKAFPVDRIEHLNFSYDHYEFPAIYIADVHNVLVTGGTNLVMMNNSVIAHDLYDFTHDYTSEELHGKTFIWPHRHCIAWLMCTKSMDKLPRGACFTDACATNYAHWMSEVLPRINLFCSREKSVDVPIIVDDGLHANLMESLRIVVGSEREIIIIRKGVGIQVDCLLLTSVTGYVPFGRRSNRLKDHSHGHFSPFALQSLRQCLLERLGDTSPTSVRNFYIKRNSDLRNITNAKEIEEILITRGFTVVEPEHLTLEQQVALFSNASVVVGPTGAAMANLIFCMPSTKVIILISDYKYMPYGYWQSMACAVGNCVTYVVGQCVGIWSYLHSDYRIDIADVLDAIGDSATV